MTNAPISSAREHPSPTNAPTLAWISWLRVAAIAGVVGIHVGGFNAAGPHARHTSVGVLGLLLDFSSRWAVPVFVMLSGALLLDPARYRGAEHFWRKRALRLLPAVVFWHVAYLSYLEASAGPIGLSEIIERVLTGRLYTALYFFWIVIGLAAVTPVLMPWVATASHRALLLVACVATALPVLDLVTVPARSDQLWTADQAWVRTPWTWWLLYLGYYLLGYALREVALRARGQVIAVIVAGSGTALLVWQWGRASGLGGTLERYVPAEAYVSPTVVVVAVCVYLLAHSWIQPTGLLSPLCRRGAVVAGRRLGDATLGVYGVHLLVLALVLSLPVIGGANVAGSAVQLLARWTVVLVVAYVVSLAAHRVPLLRRVF